MDTIIVKVYSVSQVPMGEQEYLANHINGVQYKYLLFNS